MGRARTVALAGLLAAVALQLEASARARTGVLDEAGLLAVWAGGMLLIAHVRAWALLLAAGLALSGVAADGADILSVPLLIALLATAVVARDLALRPALAVAVPVVLCAAIPDALHRPPADALGTVLGEFVYFALPFALGRALRTAQQLNGRLEERNGQLREEREQRVALAVEEERARVGDELRTLVIAGLREMLAAAGRVPPAFADVEVVGRATLAQMRVALRDLATAAPHPPAVDPIAEDDPGPAGWRMPWRRRGLTDPVHADRLAAAALFAGGLAEIAARDLVNVGRLALVSLALCVATRQRHPRAAVLTAVALLVVGRFSDGGLWDGIAPLIAFVAVVYSAAMDEREARWAAWLPWALAAGTLADLAFTHDVGIEDLPLALLVGVGPWAGARLLRRLRLLRVQLELRTLELRFEREERSRLAAERERARIALEVHDIVAHSVSLMVVQAGAGRRVAAQGDPVGEFAAAVTEAGTRSLRELEQLTGSALVAPPRDGLGRLQELVDRARGAGLDAHMRLAGGGDAPSADVALSAYRVVQEALTNVLKHADRARVDVEVDARADGLRLVITDDGGRGPRDVHSGDGAGRGLSGMRRRAGLLGGELKAGAQPGGGWQVAAWLPR